MGTLRAAIYARHSTDKQNPASSADQAAACEALVGRMGAQVVATYADPEVSGYRRDRRGSCGCCATSATAGSTWSCARRSTA